MDVIFKILHSQKIFKILILYGNIIVIHTVSNRNLSENITCLEATSFLDFASSKNDSASRQNSSADFKSDRNASIRWSRSFKIWRRFGAKIVIFSIPVRMDRVVTLVSANFSASSRRLGNSRLIVSRIFIDCSASSRSLKLAAFCKAT